MSDATDTEKDGLSSEKLPVKEERKSPPPKGRRRTTFSNEVTPITFQPTRTASKPFGINYPGAADTLQPLRLLTPIPSTIPDGCPSDLEYLAVLDMILVHQQLDALELVLGFGISNRYIMVDQYGQHIYHAVEDTECCTKFCCGKNRPFEMHLLNYYNQEPIRLIRSCGCQFGCMPCCCCLNSIEIQSPPGTRIGTVEQDFACCFPSFTVRNGSNEPILKIQGPCCTSSCSCCGSDKEFVIKTLTGYETGVISKKWTGIIQEQFVDADVFGVHFAMSLDVTVKAILLGACMLIDFMFFEKSGGRWR